MPNIAEHANMVSNSQFEDLSEESRARKMNDGEPGPAWGCPCGPARSP